MPGFQDTAAQIFAIFEVYVLLSIWVAWNLEQMLTSPVSAPNRKALQIPWLPAAPHLQANGQRAQNRLLLPLGGHQHTTRTSSSIFVTTIFICMAGDRSLTATQTFIIQGLRFHRPNSRTAHLNTSRTSMIISVQKEMLCAS